MKKFPIVCLIYISFNSCFLYGSGLEEAESLSPLYQVQPMHAIWQSTDVQVYTTQDCKISKGFFMSKVCSRPRLKLVALNKDDDSKKRYDYFIKVKDYFVIPDNSNFRNFEGIIEARRIYGGVDAFAVLDDDPSQIVELVKIEIPDSTHAFNVGSVKSKIIYSKGIILDDFRSTSYFHINFRKEKVLSEVSSENILILGVVIFLLFLTSLFLCVAYFSSKKIISLSKNIMHKWKVNKEYENELIKRIVNERISSMTEDELYQVKSDFLKKSKK